MAKKFGYEKVMEDNDLKLADLPKNAKYGIENINSILRGIKLAEGKGRKINPDIYDKIKANDEWVCHVIMDAQLGEKSPDLGALPNPAAAVEPTIVVPVAAAGAVTPGATPAEPAPVAKPVVVEGGPPVPPAKAPEPPKKKEYASDGDFLFGILD